MILRRVFEHIRPQAWTAIVIDLVIVVLGVFIGTQVSNWNTERETRQRRRNVILAVGYQIAQIHAWRSEKDQAFAWLERCFPIHDAGLVRLPFDPAMDPLRNDPRFAVLVAKMGIPK